MTSIIREETRQEEVVVARTCDRCGVLAERGSFEINEFLNHSWSGGHDGVFEDGALYEIDLCQRCVKDLIGQHARITVHGFNRSETTSTIDWSADHPYEFCVGVTALVLAAAAHAFGNDEVAAQKWLFNYYPPLDSIPVALLGTLEGMQRVIQELSRAEHGLLI